MGLRVDKFFTPPQTDQSGLGIRGFLEREKEGGRGSDQNGKKSWVKLLTSS